MLRRRGTAELLAGDGDGARHFGCYQTDFEIVS